MCGFLVLKTRNRRLFSVNDKRSETSKTEININGLGNGGEGGIRTHGTRKGTTVFKTVAFNRSATSPQNRLELFALGAFNKLAVRYCQ